MLLYKNSMIFQRMAHVCIDFVHLFFERLRRDASGTFDGIDLEKAEAEVLQDLQPSPGRLNFE